MNELNTGIDTEKRERRGGRYIWEICPDNKRDAETLIPLILKHVKTDTTIDTDM